MSKQEIPGPGAYSRDSSINGPKFGFGTDKRDHDKKNSTPGPGAYKVPTKVADVNKYVMPHNPGEEFRFV